MVRELPIAWAHTPVAAVGSSRDCFRREPGLLNVRIIGSLKDRVIISD